MPSTAATNRKVRGRHCEQVDEDRTLGLHPCRSALKATASIIARPFLLPLIRRRKSLE